MPRTFLNVNSFKSGEIGRLLESRFDIGEYKNGHRTLINQFPMRSSGSRRRPGTEFISDETAFGECRVIPFASIQGNFLLLIRSDAGVAHFKITDTDGVAQTTTNLLSGFYNGASKEGWQLEVETLNNTANLFLCHSSGTYPPIIVVYNQTTTDWDFSEFIMASGRIGLAIPYDDVNITATTLTPSGFTGSVTVTASAALFAPGDVGSFIRIDCSGTEGILEVISVASTTVLTGTFWRDCGTPTAALNWALSQWSHTRGWPSKIVKHNQRLQFASNNAFPDTIWNSRLGDLQWFMQRVLTDDGTANVSGLNYFGSIDNSHAFSIRQASGSNASNYNSIQWLASGDGIVVGGTSTESILRGNQDGYGAINPQFDTKTNYGGSNVRARVAGDSIFYASRDGKNLREFRYNQDNGSFVNTNISILNEQVVYENESNRSNFSNSIFTEITWQQSRSVLWALTSAGGLVALSFEPSSETVGWSRHPIANMVQIHGIGVLSTVSNAFDDLYLSVERVIDGSTVYYIEKVGNDFDGDSLLLPFSTTNDFPIFLDCSLRVTNGPASTVVAGLAHLEGEVVGAFADGVYVGEFTVTAGVINLLTAAAEIIIGYNYNSDIGSLPIRYNSPQGESPLLINDINRMRVSVYNTFGGIYGQDADSLDSEIEYDSDDLFTGMIEVDPDSDTDTELTYYFRQNKPYPFTILGVYLEGVAEGGD